MPYSISTLLVRNLRDVFGENDPAHCVFYDPSKESIVAVTKSIASRARSKLPTLVILPMVSMRRHATLKTPISRSGLSEDGASRLSKKGLSANRLADQAATALTAAV
jgi:hypothetical protein